MEMGAVLEASSPWWLPAWTGGLTLNVTCGCLAGVDKIGVISFH